MPFVMSQKADVQSCCVVLEQQHSSSRQSNKLTLHSVRHVKAFWWVRYCRTGDSRGGGGGGGGGTVLGRVARPDVSTHHHPPIPETPASLSHLPPPNVRGDDARPSGQRDAQAARTFLWSGRHWQYGNAAHQHISDPPALSYEQGQSRWTRRKLQGNQEGPSGSPFPFQVEINHPQIKGRLSFFKLVE